MSTNSRSSSLAQTLPLIISIFSFPREIRLTRWSDIIKQKQEALKKQLAQYNIQEKDVIEKFIRSGGPGGQNVNKTSTCVYLKHLPTGIEVKCAKERSQTLNRFLAWRLLAQKVEEQVFKIRSERQNKIEKIRRQKRKRGKRAKEKILKHKKIVSSKKRSRKISGFDLID